MESSTEKNRTANMGSGIDAPVAEDERIAGNDPEAAASTKKFRARLLSRRRGVILCLFFCAIAAGYAYQNLPGNAGEDADDTGGSALASLSSTNAADVSGTAGQAKTASAANSDDVLRKEIVGVWNRDDDGPHELTIREDGSATLVYRPASTTKRLAIGSLLTVTIEWSIKNGFVDFLSTSGEPKYGYEVAAAYEGGKHKHRRIRKIDQHEMVLLNDKKTKDKISSVWKRKQ